VQQLNCNILITWLNIANKS